MCSNFYVIVNITRIGLNMLDYKLNIRLHKLKFLYFDPIHVVYAELRLELTLQPHYKLRAPHTIALVMKLSRLMTPLLLFKHLALGK